MLPRSVERQIDRKHQIGHMLPADIEWNLLLVRFVSGRAHGVAIAQLDRRHLLVSPQGASQQLADLRGEGTRLDR